MKKEFIIPQINITEFSAEDIITISTNDPVNPPAQAVEMKTTVNGKTATSYGAVNVSIFD